MKVDLDTSQLSAMMSLWRDATDMKVRLSDKAKLHMLANRAQMLKNMVVGADHWSTILRACTAEGEDLFKLNAFRAEVTSFKQWATDGLEELHRLRLGESLADGQAQSTDDRD